MKNILVWYKIKIYSFSVKNLSINANLIVGMNDSSLNSVRVSSDHYSIMLSEHD